ncbi:unnamed protein product [Linum tenue]|uniref:AAA+ ATPase domain-containing protein n=1 Tax=Linum tenue TaxID=586396 RepID=A0AAV0PX36_9ROSI|nr:unnamed protein product [Linum tenue]
MVALAHQLGKSSLPPKQRRPVIFVEGESSSSMEDESRSSSCCNSKTDASEFEEKKRWRSEDAIAGNRAALESLRELIVFPLLYSREARKLGHKWPAGLLLYGPPGTGKTSIVRAVVQESGAHLVVISPHSVHRAHAGESERILREAFGDASSHLEAGKPSVVFIDEMDALCPRRDSRREQDVRLVSQLCALMDAIKPSSASSVHVAVVASTNRLLACLLNVDIYYQIN